jgi:Plasmid recombination enzyme
VFCLFFCLAELTTLLAKYSKSTFFKRWHNRGMAHFAIVRIQKLKSAGSVHRSLKHALREQDTPNADSERTPDNTELGAESVKEAMAAFRSRLPEKHRKDAVLAVEYLITASPEAMNSKTRTAQDAYFSDALDWLKNKHGAENVVFSGIHRDESTPHMYAYVVPRVGDKLNAKAFFGGAKALNQLQTDFSQSVGVKHGFERGQERSKAHHVPIREYYARVNEKTPETPKIDLPELSMSDRLNALSYGKKARDHTIDLLNPSFKVLQAKAAELDRIKKLDKSVARRVELEGRKFNQALNALERMSPSLQRKASERLAGFAQEEELAKTQKQGYTMDKTFSDMAASMRVKGWPDDKIQAAWEQIKAQEKQQPEAAKPVNKAKDR